MANGTKTILAVVAWTLVAGATWFFLREPQHVSVNELGKVNGIVKSIEPGNRTAMVELPDGTQVSALVTRGCTVIVGQTTSLAVFQPGASDARRYMVIASDAK